MWIVTHTTATAAHACAISGIPTHQPHIIIIYNIVIGTRLGFGRYILAQWTVLSNLF